MSRRYCRCGRKIVVQRRNGRPYAPKDSDHDLCQKCYKAVRDRERQGKTDMMDIPQRLYDSEINFSISCFWDGGFDVRLGDDMNGVHAETQVRTFAEALTWLDQEARKQYPSSLYATGKYPEGWTADGEVGA